MTANQQMKNMLDQLMGTNRDGENKSAVKFSSTKVCRSFLLNCCPHDILSATRMDLGKCSRIHDVALRADYAQASKEKDYFFDIDATEHLERFIADCDKTTEEAKVRLLETQEELSAEVTQKMSHINALSDKIGQKLAKAEEKGEAGLVEESMKLMEEVELIRKEKLTAEQQYRNSMPSSNFQQQKLRVCEVCSAYLGIYDNDHRLADHFGGKLHLGFIEIREKLAKLQANVEQRRIERRNAYNRERQRASRSRSRDRSHGDGVDEDGERGDDRRARVRHRHADSGGDRYDRDRSRSRDRRDRRRSDRERDRDYWRRSSHRSSDTRGSSSRYSEEERYRRRRSPDFY